MLNFSILDGTVPCKMKIAQVVPLSKKGSPKEIFNYRLIFLLPVLKNSGETSPQKNVRLLVGKKYPISHHFGFQPGRNTTQALVSVVDRISRAFEQGEVTIGVLLDFQKTFDTIQHKIILSKFLRHGIRGTPHRWFTTYRDVNKG
jgi:hypothetical protein